MIAHARVFVRATWVVRAALVDPVAALFLEIVRAAEMPCKFQDVEDVVPSGSGSVSLSLSNIEKRK